MLTPLQWILPFPLSCTDGTEEEDCDVKVEEEATKPTSCGMITDPNGMKNTYVCARALSLSH